MWTLPGCVKDQIDLVYLQFDTPVVQPTLSLPADTAREARFSLWVGRPSVRTREGVFHRDVRTGVTWQADTIPGPNGVGSYPVQRRDPTNSGWLGKSADTHWDLPDMQGGVLLDLPFTDEASLGLGMQGSIGPTESRWLAEGRLSTDYPVHAPSVRFSLGGFIGRHDVRAAYLRETDRGPTTVSWAVGEQWMDGFFAELVLAPTIRRSQFEPFLAFGLVSQRLLTHGVPSTDSRFGTVIMREWSTLWSITLGFRVQVSPSADLLLAPRLIIDSSLDLTDPTTFLLPVVQFNIQL